MRGQPGSDRLLGCFAPAWPARARRRWWRGRSRDGPPPAAGPAELAGVPPTPRPPAIRPTAARGTRTEPQLLRQELPLDTCVQDEQHALERLAVIDPLAPRVPEPPFMLRQQRLDHRPQLVTDLPRLPPRHGHPTKDGITYTSTVPQHDLSVRALSPRAGHPQCGQGDQHQHHGRQH